MKCLRLHISIINPNISLSNQEIYTTYFVFVIIK